jgi:hypothetical protein
MRKKTQNEEAVKEVDAFGQALRNSSGLDGMEAEIVATVGSVFRDLLLQNWSQIKTVRQRAEEATVSMSFGFEVDASGKQPLVRGKLSFSEKFSDTLESWVDDPEQIKLAFKN